jgi:transforming growth factor-beta-induced protein
VVPGNVVSTELSNGDVGTLNGQNLSIDLSAGVKINESEVIAADIQGSNGVVHVIDQVLLPE